MNQEKIWDTIAESWYHLRQKQFQPVKDFQERYKLEKGKILEIGCGNSRNLIPFAKLNFECHGIDFSKKMLQQSQKLSKKYNVKINLQEANMTQLPYKNNYFNYILHISSLHHLKSEDRILKALKESYRVLIPNGLMLLTVWNKLQLRFLLKPKDLIVPWKKDKKEYQRFYHLFDYFELKKLLNKTNFKIIESNIFGKNLVFVLKKE